MVMTHALTLPAGWMISPRLVPAWPIDGEHTLEICPAGRTDEQRIRWSYRLTRGKRTIFAGKDICSGMRAEPTTRELGSAARTVLSYLTLRPGDTDAEYFDGYTATQMAWAEAYAEELSAFAMDGICGYCGSEDHVSPLCPDMPDHGR
ncbi:hypothetical protein [Planobispora takensis]|uniref:Uncharacterized protein n=1 Tax=Planobispora takensis TaxID=1367882 RepID=A0A8J3STQ5_9ACTN|nr:hypothetical protein [Planobispora takensis]GIH99179.1 hypothetical protein Pta02_11880 [Planobispora takensis]